MLFINAIFRHSITEYSFLLLIKVLTIEHFNLYFTVLPFLSPLTFCKCCTWVLLVLQFILLVVCICIHQRYQKMLHLGRIDERSICFDQDILYGKKNLVPNQARKGSKTVDTSLLKDGLKKYPLQEGKKYH